MTSLIISLILPAFSYYLIISEFFGCKKGLKCHLAIKLPIAISIGIGFYSVIFLLILLIKINFNYLFVIDVFVFLCSTLFYFRKKNNQICELIGSSKRKNTILEKLLIITIGISLMFTFINFILHAIIEPNGRWDAWAIWNQHAKFLASGQSSWLNMFSPHLYWSHADYPLLLPSLIARSWTYLGRNDPIVPIIFSLIFALLIILALYASTSLLKTKTQGFLATLFLLMTPAFISNTNSQYADIPIAFFLLLSFVCLALYNKTKKNIFLVLTGIELGLAFFTKNEGVIFLIAIIFAWILIYRNFDSLKKLCVLLIGFFPIFPIVLYIKILAPLSYLFVGNTSERVIQNLLNIHRYFDVFKYFVHYAHNFGEFNIETPLVLIFYVLIAGITVQKENKKMLISFITTIFFILCGFFITYLLTPLNLAFHVASSLQRLLMQIWPSFIFILFLLLSTPESLLKRSRI